MKSLLAVLTVLALSAVPALAGEGRVSDQSLAKMGLSGMTAMTDAHGLQIRGLSATVGGTGIASVPGGVASNSYSAHGGHSATGGDVSLAISSGKAVLVFGFSSAH